MHWLWVLLRIYIGIAALAAGFFLLAAIFMAVSGPLKAARAVVALKLKWAWVWVGVFAYGVNALAFVAWATLTNFLTDSLKRR